MCIFCVNDGDIVLLPPDETLAQWSKRNAIAQRILH